MRVSLVMAAAAALWPAFGAAQESVSDASQVIVTAARAPEPPDAVIASVTVITRADIDRLQPHSVDELLSGLAGMTIANNGDLGKATYVFIRGTNSDHVLVLIDGVRMGSATTGAPSWEQLPVEQIDHIEILRGPASSLYGSDAIGGVVEIFTRHGTPGSSDVPSLVVSGGSHGTYQAEVGDSGSAANGWYNASATGLYTNGIPICVANAPVTADCYTTTPQQGYWSASAAASGGYRWDGATASFTALQVEGDTHFDGSIFSGDESRVGQQALGATVTVTALAPLTVILAAGQSRDRSQLYFGDVPDGFFNTRIDTASWINQLALGTSQKVMLGADFEQDVVASDTQYALNSRNDTGVFALYQGFFGREELQLSARHDDNQQFGDHFTGSAQWACRFSDALRITAMYGTAFKAPSFNDLYYPDFGNPSLRPETSHSVEAGLDGRSGLLHWAVNAYQTNIDDLIEYNPVTLAAANIDSARIRGVETQLGAAVREWRVQAQVTWLDPIDTAVNYGELLPLRARYTARVDLDRDLGPFSVGATVFGSGARYEDPANTQRLGGYTTLGLRAGWRWQPHWELQLLLANALNRDYETVLYYNTPGRSAYLTVRYLPPAGGT